MAALGDKIAANILAQTAKVPSIPWSGDGLTCELTDEGTIPEARAIGVTVWPCCIFLPPADEICCEAYQRSGQDVFNKAMVTSAEEACERAEKIGFPIMVKASEGRPQGWRRNIYIIFFPHA